MSGGRQPRILTDNLRSIRTNVVLALGILQRYFKVQRRKVDFLEDNKYENPCQE